MGEPSFVYSKAGCRLCVSCPFVRVIFGVAGLGFSGEVHQVVEIFVWFRTGDRDDRSAPRQAYIAHFMWSVSYPLARVVSSAHAGN